MRVSLPRSLRPNTCTSRLRSVINRSIQIGVRAISRSPCRKALRAWSSAKVLWQSMKLAPVAWRAMLESGGRAQRLTREFIRFVRRPLIVGSAFLFGFHEVPRALQRFTRAHDQVGQKV